MQTNPPVRLFLFVSIQALVRVFDLGARRIHRCGIQHAAKCRCSATFECISKHGKDIKLLLTQVTIFPQRRCSSTTLVRHAAGVPMRSLAWCLCICQCGDIGFLSLIRTSTYRRRGCRKQVAVPGQRAQEGVVEPGFQCHAPACCAVLLQTMHIACPHPFAIFAYIQSFTQVQDAIGTGYLSAFPTEHFDRLQNLQPVWAPFYVVCAGLKNQMKLCVETCD